MTMTVAVTTVPHILIFPFPAQGHLIPILDFTHYLALRRQLQITILVTPKNLPLLQPLLSRHPSIQPLTLPFPDSPGIPPGVENTKDLPPSSTKSAHVSFMNALSGLRSPLLNWFQTTPSPPSVIISDMFLGWTHHLASDLGIPRIVFSPSAAFALSVIYHLWRNMPQLPENPSESITFPDLPNSPNWIKSQLSPIYRSYVPGDPQSELVKDGFLADIDSWGIAFNSFAGLESKYLEYLKIELGHDRVWAVGPLLSPPSESVASRGGTSSVSVPHLEAWLDTCPDDKVVYVCFGSEAVLTEDQSNKLASGLEKSGVQFVWRVKDVEGGRPSIPEGFEDRVAGRGVVIRGWAPQVMILSHRAVGAFLTHCGWNSVLEGIVAGVPMLAWPMGADQFIDATLLVEELKMAVRVCEGKESVPDSEVVASKLSELMEEDREERKLAKELSLAAKEAVSEGGSSVKDMESLVEQLVQLYSSSD
uniref:Glycosyltransferase n=1 Tax=Linum usitatissimum TaxID=4006 RepID=I2BHC6_LINUS|nr:UDP-glycosyltransferase 1 [Linum usitatissimum]